MKCAFTLFGKDKPGIISAFTSYLSSEQINIEDASMTILHDQFAMILVADLGSLDPAELEIEISGISQLSDLKISLTPIAQAKVDQSVEGYSLYILHLATKDTIGVVAKVASVLADFGANIIDCSTRKNEENDIFTLILDTQVPNDAQDALVDALEDIKNQFAGDLVFRKVDDVEL